MENRSRSILLVEDDSDIRDSITEILSEEGFSVAVAGNGSEALAALKRQSGFDLILLDRAMPEMDGISFLRERALVPAHASIPVLLMTARVPEEALPAGVDRVISKPFDIDALLLAVRDLLKE